MKNNSFLTYILTFFLLIMPFLSISQAKYTIPFEGLVSVDSKDGMNELKEDYNFIVSIKSDNTLIMKRKESHPATNATIINKTDKYITAKISETGYFFFDVEDELVYTIDKFQDRYITIGYSDNLESIKDFTQTINDWQQSGKEPTEILDKLHSKLILNK